MLKLIWLLAGWHSQGNPPFHVFISLCTAVLLLGQKHPVTQQVCVIKINVIQGV